MSDQKPTMIDGGIRSILAHCFPCMSVGIKSERHRRRFSGLAVVADSVVVIRSIRATGEINSVRLLSRRLGTRRYAVVSVAGMCWEFRPLDFCNIALARNFAHPAFIGCDIFRARTRGILIGPVHVNNSVANDGAGVTKHW